MTFGSSLIGRILHSDRVPSSMRGEMDLSEIQHALKQLPREQQVALTLWLVA